MWKTEHSVDTTAGQDALWRVLADAETAGPCGILGSRQLISTGRCNAGQPDERDSQASTGDTSPSRNSVSRSLLSE